MCVYSTPRMTSRASKSSGTSALVGGNGWTRLKSPRCLESSKIRLFTSSATASGSDFICSARSSASPAVAHLAQLTDQSAFRLPEGFAKDLVPLIPEGEQKRLSIPLRGVGTADKLQLAGGHCLSSLLEPILLVGIHELALD